MKLSKEKVKKIRSKKQESITQEKLIRQLEKTLKTLAEV